MPKCLHGFHGALSWHDLRSINDADVEKSEDMKAQTLFIIFFRLWPSYASAHNNLGTLTAGDQAERHFLAAIHAQPSHVNAHYNLGQLYR